MSLQTPLAKARGLGAAKHGLHHWLAQRVSALALVFLAIWFVSSLMLVASKGTDILSLVSSPFHAALFILFIGTALYHGALGVQVVIEDYVHCKCVKSMLLVGTKFIAIATAVITILAIANFHIHTSWRAAYPGMHAPGYVNCHKQPCRGKEGKWRGKRDHYRMEMRMMRQDNAPSGAMMMQQAPKDAPAAMEQK